MLQKVRSRSGAPVIGDFIDSDGSPIVIDDLSGAAYAAKPDGSIIGIGGGAVGVAPRGGGLDDYANVQAQVDSWGNVDLLPGTFTFYTPVTLNNGMTIGGCGRGVTTVRGMGVDAFRIASDNVRISNMGLLGYTVGGVIDAKTQKGINVQGTSGTPIYSAMLNDLFMRGWASAMYLSYDWQSVIHNVTTVYNLKDVHLFGQSVNNSISQCNLNTTGGTASIYTERDGSTRGEGLMVEGSLIYGGAYGVQVDTSFLSLNIIGNVIDGISDTALAFSNCQDSNVIGNWIYSVNYGVYLAGIGSPADQLISICGNHIEVSGANAKNIRIDPNNNIGTIHGNTLISSVTGGTERLIYIEGLNWGVDGNALSSASANPPIFVNALGVKVGRQNVSSGSPLVQYFLGQSNPTQTVTSASYTVLPTDESIIANRAGTVTLTLPTAAYYSGYPLRIRTITANAVVADSAVVVPLAGGAAATGILAATAGKWAELVSDGTNWNIQAAN